MPSIEGLKRRLQEYKPQIRSVFIVYTPPRKSNISDDETFEYRLITSPDDPVIPRICSRWQLDIAKAALAEGRWRVMVAFKDGEPVGRVWEALKSERRFAVGLPRFRLNPDEILMFDLFVEREYRRSSIAAGFTEHYFAMYDPDDTYLKYAYGFIEYDNSGSILWHHSAGFNIVQTINYVTIGPRIKWRVPFSDNPRFGPMSRKGRFNQPDKELFGTSLMPNL